MPEFSNRRRFTDTQCFDAIRRYEQSLSPDERPSEPNYTKWQRNNPEAPTSQTLVDRYGTWNKARLLAAHTPEEVKLNNVGRTPHITSEICRNAIRHYAEEHPGKRVSYEKFEMWHKKDKNTPSGRSILRNSKGKSWQDIVQAALSEEEQTR